MRTDERGLPLTTNNDAAVAHYDRTIRHYLEYRTATIEALQQTLAADPEFVMGHCLKGYLGMLASRQLVKVCPDTRQDRRDGAR